MKTYKWITGLLAGTSLFCASAQAEIIIVTDPAGRVVSAGWPVLASPVMGSIVFAEPQRDNPIRVRRSLTRSHVWSAYKGNAVVYDNYYYGQPWSSGSSGFNQSRFPSPQAQVDYSLRRSHAFRMDLYK